VWKWDDVERISRSALSDAVISVDRAADPTLGSRRNAARRVPVVLLWSVSRHWRTRQPRAPVAPVLRSDTTHPLGTTIKLSGQLSYSGATCAIRISDDLRFRTQT